MIEKIIKRGGAIEAFQPEKLNGWGEWAAKSLGSYVDWPSVIMTAVATLPEVCSSATLQQALIQTCLDMDSWSYNRMAGRLFASVYHKELYGSGEMPTVLEVHRKLQSVGLMVELDYSEAEYQRVENLINHERDFKYAHFQLEQLRGKYAVRNRTTSDEYETPQYIFMRMAMALSEGEPRSMRLTHVKKWYDFFSRNGLNAPTPNYTNLGTPHNGYASCCIYTTHDSAASLGVGDHIAYMMTVMSAGIGSNIQCRSVNDPVRGGLIKHQGKLPYYRALAGAVRANMQNGRAGACTTYYSAFDPEVKELMVLRNPNTPVSKRIGDLDYAMVSNKFLARRAARKQDVFLFNIHTAPDLHAAFYGPDLDLFESLYAKYEADDSFKKVYVPAREIALTGLNEANTTGRSYLWNADEANRHTPYKDPIYSSNLCLEINEHTEGYENMKDLYTAGPVGHIRLVCGGERILLNAVEGVYIFNRNMVDAAQNLKFGDEFELINSDNAPFLEGTYTVDAIEEVKREPEVALCSLGGIVISNIHSDEEYFEAMYYALKMIDVCIHKAEYALPHIGYTAKNRMAAGVGIMDLAHYLAKRKLSYTSQEGKDEIHRVAERHMYFAIKASLKIASERGVAPWIHRTKWAEGWLPIDTYNRNVDKVVTTDLQYDWEALREEVIAMGGIAHSVLIALMPGESSSKASGTANSIYPIRELTMLKTDNNMTVTWAAPEGDKLAKYYEPVWSIPNKDLIEMYGIFQKFTDQGISADLFRDLSGNAQVTDTTLLEEFFHMNTMGLKSRYYVNSKTSAKPTMVSAGDVTLNLSLSAEEAEPSLESSLDERGCAGGFCTL